MSRRAVATQQPSTPGNVSLTQDFRDVRGAIGEAFGRVTELVGDGKEEVGERFGIMAGIRKTKDSG